MNTRHTTKSGLVIALLALLTMLVVGSATAASTTPITFRLNWVPTAEGDHAFYYMAKDLGYYKNAGLDVTIQPGSGSGDTVSRVGAGKVPMGYADTSTSLVGMSKGANIIIVAVLQQNSMNAFWAKKSSGIRTPKDLVGKTIGAPAGDLHRVMWPAFAEANGIDPSSVNWVNVAPQAKVQTLAAGRIDATVNFIDQKPVYEKALGKGNVVEMKWSDYGVNPYGNAIIANRDWAKQHPEAVRAFLDATLKGARWVAQHPKEAIQRETKNVSGLNTDLVTQMLDIGLTVIDSPAVDQHGMGWVDKQHMQSTIDIVNKSFKLDNPLKVDDVYTNKYLTQVDWPLASGN